MKIALFIFYLFYSLALIMFMLGFHNIDLAYNFLHLGYSMDCNIFGCKSLDDYYILGITQMIISCSSFIVAIMMLFPKDKP
jgi:hypothetical protein